MRVKLFEEYIVESDNSVLEKQMDYLRSMTYSNKQYGKRVVLNEKREIDIYGDFVPILEQKTLISQEVLFLEIVTS